MAIKSPLTKGVRRAKENNKTQNTYFSPKNGNKQGDCDSESTSITSSMHGSTSNSSSSEYSSGIERGNEGKKTLEKSNSKKSTGFKSFRLFRRRQQPPPVSSPEDAPATALQKPMQKFTRSGSLRSLKIVRNKNTFPSESKKISNVEDLRSKKATFSSLLKDSKFPEQVVPIKEYEEVIPVGKLCPYQHCSLHGHHHHNEPPLKRFSYLKRRSSKDHKSINPQTRATDNKTETKVTKKVSKEGGKAKKNKDVDFSIEFYAKTRPEPVLEARCGFDDIMFGVNSDYMDDRDSSLVNIDGKNENSDGFVDVEAKEQVFNDGKQMSMWRLLHRYMVFGLVEQPESELDHEEEGSETKGFDNDNVVNQENEIQKMFVIKMVREAIEKFLLPELEKNQSTTSEVIQQESSETDDRESSSEKERMNGWSYVKKFTVLKRFLTELEKAKKFDAKKRKYIPFVPEPEAENVSLRHQTFSEKKNSDEWMLDYALQQAVGELAQTQKQKVVLLVKAFETVAPMIDQSVEAFKESDRTG